MNLKYFGGSGQRDVQKYVPGVGSLFESIGKQYSSSYVSKSIHRNM